MFHVVTVHWHSDAWIEPQLAYLERFMPSDYRVYAALNGVSKSHFGRFYFAADLDGTHPAKLDELARIALADADPDDFLVFLDGDAFPVAPIHDGITEGRQIAAVRRDEDFGERYPHPCFCVCRAGTWRALGSTWAPGPIVTNSLGQPITDVGCTLLRDLEAAGIEWTALLRSNQRNLHPLWFGVYASVVYHHGAGFRERTEHIDAQGGRTINPRVAARSARSPSWSGPVHRVERAVRYRLADRRRTRFLASDASRQGRDTADEVYQRVLHDPEFVRFFDPSVATS